MRACGEWSNEVRGAECLDRWSFSITIPQGSLKPGVYDLAQSGATFGDLFVRTSPDPDTGCAPHRCRTSVKGIGTRSLEGSKATLIIDSADDQCITGTISDFQHPSFGDAPSYDGAFFAVRCAP